MLVSVGNPELPRWGSIAVGLAGMVVSIPALRAAWQSPRGLSWLNAILGWVLAYFQAGLFLLSV
jgi:hypothetical protein